MVRNSYWSCNPLPLLGNKPKKFDFVYQTICRWKVRMGWVWDYVHLASIHVINAQRPSFPPIFWPVFSFRVLLWMQKNVKMGEAYSRPSLDSQWQLLLFFSTNNQTNVHYHWCKMLKFVSEQWLFVPIGGYGDNNNVCISTLMSNVGHFIV